MFAGTERAYLLTRKFSALYLKSSNYCNGCQKVEGLVWKNELFSSSHRWFSTQSLVNFLKVKPSRNLKFLKHYKVQIFFLHNKQFEPVMCKGKKILSLKCILMLTVPDKYIIFLERSGTKWLGTKSLKFSTGPTLLHSTARGGFSSKTRGVIVIWKYCRTCKTFK